MHNTKHVQNDFKYALHNSNVEILNKKDKQQSKTKSKQITLQLMML